MTDTRKNIGILQANMSVDLDPSDLIERLCRSLAFHLVESEITLRFSEGNTDDWEKKIAKAKTLIAEAGFDIDVLYPPEERPTAEECAR